MHFWLIFYIFPWQPIFFNPIATMGLIFQSSPRRHHLHGLLPKTLSCLCSFFCVHSDWWWWWNWLANQRGTSQIIAEGTELVRVNVSPTQHSFYTSLFDIIFFLRSHGKCNKVEVEVVIQLPATCWDPDATMVTQWLVELRGNQPKCCRGHLIGQAPHPLCTCTTTLY